MKILTHCSENPQRPRREIVRGRKLILLAFFFCISPLVLFPKGSAQDYIVYHKTINAAEANFFLNQNPKDALKAYRYIYNNYDFVFPEDFLVACFVALKSDDLNLFYQFSEKAFESGLPFDNIERLYKLNNLIDQNKMQEIFQKARKVYLGRINYEALDKVYSMMVRDWSNWSAWEIVEENGMRIINMQPFPGEKIIGIDTKKIMQESGKEYKDFYQRLDEAKSYNPNYHDSRHFFEDPSYNYLNNSYIIYMLLHWGCCSAYNLNLKFEELVKAGLLHPRDFALINDWGQKYKLEKQKNCCPEKCIDGLFFKVSPIMHNYNRFPISLDSINAVRARYYIQSFEVDKVIQKTGKSEEINLNYGVFSHR